MLSFYVSKTYLINVTKWLQYHNTLSYIDGNINILDWWWKSRVF